MSGKAHAHHGQIAPPGYFDVNQRQGDGNPELAVQDVVEIAVPRVVVFLFVATELFLLKEKLVHALDVLDGGTREVAVQAQGKGVEPSELVGHIEVRVFGAGDEQRRFVKVELFLCPLHEAREVLDGVENLHREAQRLFRKSPCCDQARKRLRSKKNRFAGLSARRRMK